MTVSTTNSVTRYLGNGVTRDFPTGFPFGDLTNVGVKLLTELGAEVDLVYGEDYTVTGGDGATGSVNLTVAPSSLEQIAVYRKTPQTQETDYGSGDPFPSASHEQALDKLTYTVQELQAEVDRSIKVQVTSDTTPDQLIEQLTSDAADAKQAALDSKDEADRSKGEADRSKDEADRSKDEADRSKDEADRAYEIVESAKELFEIKPHNGPLDSIQVGFIPGIGQTWLAATYPEAAAGLEAGKQFMVSELLWQTGVSGNPDAYKGCWSSGGTDEQGRRWYRAPKLNRDGGYRAPFLRGSEIGVDAGVMTDDRMRALTGQLGLILYPAGQTPTGSVDGTINSTSISYTQGGSNVLYSVSLNSAKQSSVGPEHSPRYHGVIMCIRMFGTVSNPGSVDAAQLATDLGVANAKIAALESRNNPEIDFIYPNGGTATAPANVVSNWRGVFDNPWPGYHVTATAFLYNANEWGESGWDGNGGSGTSAYGVKAGYNATLDKIIVQTGSAGVSTSNNQTGALHGNVSAAVTSLPCYIMVEKKGKRNG